MERFPELGPRIRAAYVILPPNLNIHVLDDDNCLLNCKWESANTLHLMPCPNYFKIGIAESVA